ncbi:uncharacterized protein LOC110454400 [Mizuhopecten yessoensis]|uniref:uncharacterized protein LOC110454400 n=1 Tax=Mizuhopecten yessoensis TaxID=6573 RepID=UPI000B457C62|nr:uncharacterized protein LOC110454400 [Mizuhopecten yessoensis]
MRLTVLILVIFVCHVYSHESRGLHKILASATGRIVRKAGTSSERAAAAGGASAASAAVSAALMAVNPVAGAASVFLAPLVDGVVQLEKQFMSYLSENMLGNHPFHTVLGRGVRIHATGTTISIQDVASGITVVGTGATVDEAMSMATQKYVTTLLEMGFISKDDLHLAPILTTTEVPCGDNYPKSYCEDQKQQGFCSPRSAYATFMSDNCYATCRGGC